MLEFRAEEYMRKEDLENIKILVESKKLTLLSHALFEALDKPSFKDVLYFTSTVGEKASYRIFSRVPINGFTKLPPFFDPHAVVKGLTDFPKETLYPEEVPGHERGWQVFTAEYAGHKVAVMKAHWVPKTSDNNKFRW